MSDSKSEYEESWEKRLEAEERKTFCIIFGVIIALTLIGILLGYIVQTGVLIAVTLISVFFTWARIVGGGSDNILLFVCTLYVSIVSWITCYFATGQHWIGDFVRTYILR